MGDILLFILLFYVWKNSFIGTECKKHYRPNFFPGHKIHRGHHLKKGYYNSWSTPSTSWKFGSTGGGGYREGGRGAGGYSEGGGGGGGYNGGGGGGGYVEGGGGGGFAVGQSTFLKHKRSGMCMYPKDGKTDIGTEVQLESERCFGELSKYTVSANGVLHNDGSGLCLKVGGDEIVENVRMILSNECEGKTAKFEMTPFGSIKVKGYDFCVQPLSGGEPPLVIKATCDNEETKFLLSGGSSGGGGGSMGGGGGAMAGGGGSMSGSQGGSSSWRWGSTGGDGGGGSRWGSAPSGGSSWEYRYPFKGKMRDRDMEKDNEHHGKKPHDRLKILITAQKRKVQKQSTKKL